MKFTIFIMDIISLQNCITLNSWTFYSGPPFIINYSGQWLAAIKSRPMPGPGQKRKNI